MEKRNTDEILESLRYKASITDPRDVQLYLEAASEIEYLRDRFEWLHHSIRELFAAQAHVSWSGWMQYLFKKTKKLVAGTENIPGVFVRQWRRQMVTPYDQLPEKEKTSRRKEADAYLAILLRPREEFRRESVKDE